MPETTGNPLHTNTPNEKISGHEGFASLVLMQSKSSVGSREMFTKGGFLCWRDRAMGERRLNKWATQNRSIVAYVGRFHVVEPLVV
jgi:hypothetical protein